MESTLSVDYGYLLEEIGFKAGYGRAHADWPSQQRLDVDRAIDSGLRRFYQGYPWTFLHPVTTLVTVANTEDYNLPDDFGGMDGSMTFGQSTGWISVRKVGEGKIRSLRQTDYGTGRPQYVAIRPRAFNASVGHRFEALLWPKADTAYTLTYRYHVLLNKLSEAAPFPPGGMLHGETILAVCLWAFCGMYIADEAEQAKQDYLERLADSIEIDKNMNTADFSGPYGAGEHNIGINADDLVTAPQSYNVTVKGVQY